MRAIIIRYLGLKFGHLEDLREKKALHSINVAEYREKWTKFQKLSSTSDLQDHLTSFLHLQHGVISALSALDRHVRRGSNFPFCLN